MVFRPRDARSGSFSPSRTRGSVLASDVTAAVSMRCSANLGTRRAKPADSRNSPTPSSTNSASLAASAAEPPPSPEADEDSGCLPVSPFVPPGLTSASVAPSACCAAAAAGRASLVSPSPSPSPEDVGASLGVSGPVAAAPPSSFAAATFSGLSLLPAAASLGAFDAFSFFTRLRADRPRATFCTFMAAKSSSDTIELAPLPGPRLFRLAAETLLLLRTRWPRYVACTFVALLDFRDSRLRSRCPRNTAWTFVALWLSTRSCLTRRRSRLPRYRRCT
mmetsp:Transcript_13188/g.46136  ORF Transcript_13188/g.46136 Transcript_13188/m.46136 type:complete len:277 (+) Transcript_13188:2831-3661(+)